jgi:branched-chain amino acid transport system permease protein
MSASKQTSAVAVAEGNVPSGPVDADGKSPFGEPIAAFLARRSWLFPAALFVVICFAPWLGLTPTTLRVIQLGAIFTMVVSGVNLTWGYAGELTLGQIFIYALGAYIGGYFATHGITDLFVGLAASAAAGVLVGLIVGLPGLRVSGLSFAMVSFFLILLIPDIASILPGITGGFTGIFGINDITVFGTQISGNAYIVILVVIAGMWLLIVRNLVTSEYGRGFDVLRASPVLAESLGISVYRQKLKAYVIGSIPAAMAGFMFAHLDAFVSPSDFVFATAVSIIAASVIGGNRSIYGAVIGAVLLQIGPLVTSSFQSWDLTIYGVLVLVGALVTTGGIAGLATRSGWRLMRRLGYADTIKAARIPRPADDRVPASPPEGASTLVAQAPDPSDQTEGFVEIRGVSKSFGGNNALDDVSMSLTRGAVTALIGANGSGKTTLLNILSGFYQPNAGEIIVDGTKLAGRSTSARYKLGIGRTFQTPQVVSEMAVMDAVALGAWSRDPVGIARSVLRTPGSRRALARHRASARRAMSRLGIEDRAWEEAAAMPLGTRRLIEVARALIETPRMLLLDEPASGLSVGERQALGELLARLKGSSMAVLLVEHNVEFVMSVADYACVLDQGRVIAQGTPQEVMRDPAVVASFTGRVR